MRRKRWPVRRPLSQKFFLLTVTLVFWVIAVMLAYDLRVDTLDAAHGALLLLMVALVSAAIGKFTSRALVQPIADLQEGFAAAEKGELTPVEVRATRDEVELLGNSFNHLIGALAESQQEIRLRVAELEGALERAKLEPGNEAAREQLQAAQQTAQSLSALLNQMQHSPVQATVET